jgi:hypothetical protein
MSWQTYIENLQTKHHHGQTIGNCVEKAGIISLADGSIWANSPNFGLYGYPLEIPSEDGAGTQTVEINEIVDFLHVVNHDGASNSPAGIRIANEKYFKVNSDPTAGTIYLKKNGGGACIVKCNQCIVFGSWDGAQSTTGDLVTGQTPGLCNEQCEKVGAHLKEAGY